MSDARSEPGFSSGESPPAAAVAPFGPLVPLPALDAEGRIVVDLPCSKCGYNLRTLAAEAICPECAAPVAPSLAAYRLVPLQWIDTVAGGAGLLAFATLVGGLAVAVALAEVSLGGASGVACATAPLLTVAAFTGGLGTLLLTVRDPRPAAAAPRVRRAIRILLLGGPLVAVGAGALVTLGAAALVVRGRPMAGLIGAGLCSVWALALVATFNHYLAELTRRFGAPRVAGYVWWLSVWELCMAVLLVTGATVPGGVPLVAAPLAGIVIYVVVVASMAAIRINRTATAIARAHPTDGAEVPPAEAQEQ
jgi:hypothetical protein